MAVILKRRLGKWQYDTFGRKAHHGWEADLNLERSGRQFINPQISWIPFFDFAKRGSIGTIRFKMASWILPRMIPRLHGNSPCYLSIFEYLSDFEASTTSNSNLNFHTFSFLSQDDKKSSYPTASDQ